MLVLNTRKDRLPQIILPCSTKFLREFNFANGRFFVCVLRELFFRSAKTGFSCWELIFAISGSRLLFGIKYFLSTNNQMHVNNMQMYNTLIS